MAPTGSGSSREIATPGRSREFDASGVSFLRARALIVIRHATKRVPAVLSWIDRDAKIDTSVSVGQTTFESERRDCSWQFPTQSSDSTDCIVGDELFQKMIGERRSHLGQMHWHILGSGYTIF